MFVCLNRFVIFRMYGDENVNVAHFVLSLVFLVVVVSLFCVVFVGLACVVR